MPSKFWQVKNEVNGNSEILLYGPIAGESSWWGDEVTPKNFAADLESLGGRDVTVRINSGGGDVFAAHAIHNQLVAYKGRVTVVIDGLAASAATIIAVAGDRIIMPCNALFMIHNPAIGLSDYYGADELLRVAEALNTIKDSIVAAYRKRCKASAEELAAMMDAETWMGAAECLEKGFVDEIQGSVSTVLNGSSLVVNSVNFDVKNFKNQDALKACLNKKLEVKTMNKLEAFLNSLGLKLADENQPTASAPVQNALPAVQNQQTAVDLEQIAKNAVEAERQRIAALEALDGGDNQAVTAIIAEAKKNGKTADDVKPYINAVKTISPVQNAAQQLVANMIGDNKASGVEGIGTGAVDDAAVEKAADAKAMDAMAQVMNKKFGGAK